MSDDGTGIPTTAAEIAWNVRNGVTRAVDVVERHLADDRPARRRDPRVQPRSRRCGARSGGGDRRGACRSATTRVRSPACRWRSRTTCAPVPWRRPARRRSSTAGRRRTTPRSSPGCATPGRSSSARPTSTSSRWVRAPRTRRSGRPATRTTRRGSRGDRAAVRRPRSPRTSPRSPSAPTPAARSASPPRCAASSA